MQDFVSVYLVVSYLHSWPHTNLTQTSLKPHTNLSQTTPLSLEKIGFDFEKTSVTLSIKFLDPKECDEVSRC